MEALSSGEIKRIAFIGRTKVGKALLVNTLFEQKKNQPQFISNFVETRKSKLIKNGPNVFIDIIDITSINQGNEICKNYYLPFMATADFAVVVLDARKTISDVEEELFRYLNKIRTNFIVAVNKIELGINGELLNQLKKINAFHFEVSCKENVGLDSLKSKMIQMLPVRDNSILIDDLVSHGEIVLMVIPDEINKIRRGLYNTQLQAIKQSLSEDAIVVLTRESEVNSALMSLRHPPTLVISDSSVIKTVSAIVSYKVHLTTFAILMARRNGFLSEFIKGMKQIERLNDNDKVLISEGCCEHPTNEPVSKNKIPLWLKTFTKKDLEFNYICGRNYPENISEYKMIIHCSGCMLNKKEFQKKIYEAKMLDIPITSYGVLLAYINEALPRVIMPFNEIMNVWEKQNLQLSLV